MDLREFSTMARRAVREVLAKERPETLFEQAFHDLREKVRELKFKLEKEAAQRLQSQVISDLQARGVRVLEAKLSLGKYRGSGFVTSFKLKVAASQGQAEKMAEYLRGRYSPKWKVKAVSDDGIAELNVR